MNTVQPHSVGRASSEGGDAHMPKIVWRTLLAGHKAQQSGNQGSTDDFPRLPTLEELSEALKAQFRAKEKRKSDAWEEQNSDAWEEAAKIVQEYSDEMIDRWNKAIDSLLIFAGLFSAILTAFNVQSYQLLQPAPTDQTVASAILMQVSAQIASFTVNPSFLNSSQPAFDAASSGSATNGSFQAPTYAIWLNSLWFAGLVFGISSATIGIVVKQWLNEFTAGLFGTSRETARRRQYRLNKLLEWKVPAIVATLPVLLLLALVFFLAGLLILLYNVNRTVFVATTALTAALLAFLFFTTILPAFSSSCCYHSPQSYAASAILRSSLPGVIVVLVFTVAPIGALVFSLLVYAFRLFKRRNKFWKIARMGATKSVGVLRWLFVHWRSLFKVPGFGERVALSGAPGSLDIDIFVTVYRTLPDARRVESVELCLADVGDEHTAHEYAALFRRFLWAHSLAQCQIAPLQIRQAIQVFLDATTAERWKKAYRTFMRVPYLPSTDILAFVSSSSQPSLSEWPTYHAWLLLYTRVALEGFPDDAGGLTFCKVIATTASALTASAQDYKQMRLVSLNSGHIALGSYVGVLGLCLQSVSKYAPDSSSEDLYRAICADVHAEVDNFHRLVNLPPARWSPSQDRFNFTHVNYEWHLYASYKMLADGIAAVVGHQDADLLTAVCVNPAQLVEDLDRVFATFIGSTTLHPDPEFAGACRDQLRELKEKVGSLHVDSDPPVAATS